MGSPYELVEHHKALYVQMVPAVLLTCLFWGWIGEAAICAVCWKMFLKPGELVTTKSFYDACYQSSRLALTDLIGVVWIGLVKLKLHELVLPCSLSTLRHRQDKPLLPPAVGGPL